MISDGRHMTGHKDPGLGAARENRFAVDFEIKAGRPGPLFGERFMRSLVVGRHAFLAHFTIYFHINSYCGFAGPRRDC